MHLTDEQWLLIKPLLPPPSPAARGRPLADDRLVLDGILSKLGASLPWYDLPPGEYPSWQTCYRRYRQWQRLGLIDELFFLLWDDLRDRGGLDVKAALQDGTFTFKGTGRDSKFIIAPQWHFTWQLATALLLMVMVMTHFKKPSRRLRRCKFYSDLPF